MKVSKKAKMLTHDEHQLRKSMRMLTGKEAEILKDMDMFKLQGLLSLPVASTTSVDDSPYMTTPVNKYRGNRIISGKKHLNWRRTGAGAPQVPSQQQ